MKQKAIKYLLGVFMILSSFSGVLTINAAETTYTDEELLDLIIKKQRGYNSDLELQPEHYENITSISTVYSVRNQETFEYEHHFIKDMNVFKKINKESKNKPDFSGVTLKIGVQIGENLPNNLDYIKDMKVDKIRIGEPLYYQSIKNPTESMLAESRTKTLTILNFINSQLSEKVSVELSLLDNTDYEFLDGFSLAPNITILSTLFSELTEENVVVLPYEYSHEKDGVIFYKITIDNPLKSTLKLEDNRVVVKDEQQLFTNLALEYEDGTFVSLEEDPIFYGIDGSTIVPTKDEFWGRVTYHGNGVSKFDVFLTDENINAIQENFKKGFTSMSREKADLHNQNIQFQAVIDEGLYPNIIEMYKESIISNNAKIKSIDEQIQVALTEGHSDYSTILSPYYSQNSKTSDDIFNIRLDFINNVRVKMDVPDLVDVTFDSNGGSYVPPYIGVSKNTTIFEPERPTNNGKNFLGWYTAKDFETQWVFHSDKVVENMTLYARWEGDVPEEVKHTVSFDTHGGSAIAPYTDVENGAKILAPTAPTNGDLSFLGWYKEATYDTEWDFGNDTVTSSITLHARWSIPPVSDKHTVSFDTHGGSTIAPYTDVENGAKILAPTAPTNGDLTFLGWYKEATYDTEWDFGNDTVTSSITLHARWSTPPVSDKHTVSFDTHGGTPIAPYTDVENGAKILAPTAPTNGDLTFLGWYKEATYDTEWDFGNDTVTSSITLHARWKPAKQPEIYIVNFDSMGGSAVAPQSVLENTKVNIPSDPIRANHKFVGWYTESNYVSLYDFDTLVNANRTLYARWELEELPIDKYTVTFDSNGGTKVDSITNILKGNTINEPQSPTREGFVFEGWFTANDFKTAWNFNEDTVEEDTTLYARWNIKEKPVVPPVKPPVEPDKETPQTSVMNHDVYYIVAICLSGIIAYKLYRKKYM